MSEVGDIFPTLVGPSSVKALQDAINADFTALRLALIKCADAKTFNEQSADWLPWQNIKARVLSYLAETPSWIFTKDQVDRGQLLQRELATWHPRVDALGCTAGPAPMLPEQSGLSTLFAGTSLGMLLVVAAFLLLSKGK